MHVTEQLPRETGRDYAMRVLKENIINLQLAPGSMVSENELSAQMGLSRTPVREALIELSKVGIVEIYPQKGSRIALIDDGLVEQAYFVRQALECRVVREVCEKVREPELFKLRNSIALQEHFLHSTEGEIDQTASLEFMELDNTFHELLYHIAGKELVYSITQELLIHLDRVRSLTIAYLKPDTIIAQHRDILGAIEAREGYMAEALLRKHLERYKGVEQALRDQHPDYFV